jgi:hypothetical protein
MNIWDRLNACERNRGEKVRAAVATRYLLLKQQIANHKKGDPQTRRDLEPRIRRAADELNMLLAASEG